MLKRVILAMMLLSLLVLSSSVLAQQEFDGTTSGPLNVRTEPSTNGAVMGTLNTQDAVVIERRNSIGDWIIVRTPDGGLRGWVASRYVYFPEGTNVQMLDESSETFNVASAPAPAQNSAPASTDDVLQSEFVEAKPATGSYTIPELAYQDIGQMEGVLNNLPTFHNFVTDNARRIFAIGQAEGNRRDVFTRVGDSISANQPFMNGFGVPADYNLGPEYGYLQDTINYFSVTPPRAGYANSFLYDSMAEESAFNAGAVLDRIWTNPNLCDPQTEAPLQCEYRLTQPAFSVIMLGSVDTQIYDIQLYTDFMNRVVEITMSEGIVPVLTTFPIPPDYIYYEQSLRFNMVIVDIANRHGLPVINLWKEVRPLPDAGNGPDRYHLSQGETFYVFNGEENIYGVTRRNLLTLRALHELRVNLGL